MLGLDSSAVRNGLCVYAVAYTPLGVFLKGRLDKKGDCCTLMSTYDAQRWTSVSNLQGAISADRFDKASTPAQEQLRDGNTTSNRCPTNLYHGLDGMTMRQRRVTYIVALNADFPAPKITTTCGEIFERDKGGGKLNEQVGGNGESDSRHGYGASRVEACILRRGTAIKSGFKLR